MTNQLSPDLTRILVSEVTIQQHVFELAQQISADYAGVERLYIVGVLKGAFIFLADLCRQLTIPHVVDFMALSSYGRAGAESGAVRLVMDLRDPIEGEHVLIVEDIVDKGLTLQYLVEALQGRQPTSLKTCALVRKERQQTAVSVDYLGFEIPDVWVVGYGLDYAERFRTLPFIAELNPSVYKA
ncbi:MAG TPA: hypoxanthine phosphoribosyltransferase [Chloroflexota bacterium]|nr:hypoxanthine phosphoribosyltransferase [Chloroflexota bacterium]